MVRPTLSFRPAREKAKESGAGLYLMFNARPDWIKEHWEIVETKIYPLSYDEAVDLAAAHFTELGASATIVAVLLLVNACS